MGILDIFSSGQTPPFNPNGATVPQTQSQPPFNPVITNPLFHIGLGLLANSGPSTTPRSGWEGVAEGLQNWQAARQQANYDLLQRQEADMRRRQFDAQQAEYQRKIDEDFAQKKALREAIGQAGGGYTPSDAEVFPGEDMQKFSGLQNAPSGLLGGGNVYDIASGLLASGNTQGAQSIIAIDKARRDAMSPDIVGGGMLIKNPDGSIGVNPVYMQALRESEQIKNQYQKAADPYNSTFVADDGKYYSFDARTRETLPVMVNGRHLGSGQLSPSLQGDISAAKAGGKTAAELVAKAAFDLPSVEHGSTVVNNVIDDILKDPALPFATGATGIIARNVPGTPTFNLEVKRRQLQGSAFLAAYEKLKGGGQITEVEGEKAEASLARLNAAQSTDAFVSALKDFKAEVNTLTEIARRKAQFGQSYGHRQDLPKITNSDLSRFESQNKQKSLSDFDK